MIEKRNNRDSALAELHGTLREAVEQIQQDPVPQAAERRALERARALGRTVDQSQLIEKRLQQPWHCSIQLRRMASACAVAASIVIAVAFWLAWPGPAWAQIAQAVREKAWIHVIDKDAQDRSMEGWLCPTQGISAWRIDGRVELLDARLRLYSSYDPQTKVLVRLPETEPRGKGPIEWLVETTESLFRSAEDEKAGRSDAKTRVEDLTFLAEEQAAIHLLSEKRRHMTHDGREWMAFDLTLQHRDLAEPIEMTVLVDPTTRLPHSWVTTGTFEGKSMRREVILDYPDGGPADVFALGVPRTATFVDRVPTDDIARVLHGFTAARQRFDNYHAVVVEYFSRDESNGQPTQIWRKGNRWRMEHPTIYPDDAPPFNADANLWWH